MLGEINRDFYCSCGHVLMGEFEPRQCRSENDRLCEGCSAYHRRHPTPEQFKEEYGEEYPDDGAIYFVEDDFYRDEISWKIGTYKDDFTSAYIVCACTPFGKPDKDWRP